VQVGSGHFRFLSVFGFRPPDVGGLVFLLACAYLVARATMLDLVFAEPLAGVTAADSHGWPPTRKLQRKAFKP
jgi:hypothetical protein